MPDPNPLPPQLSHLAQRDAQWRPIESAPRDGTRFLFWSGQHVAFGLYVNCKFFVAQGHPDNGIPDPTHWMPLPEPPMRDQ